MSTIVALRNTRPGAFKLEILPMTVALYGTARNPLSRTGSLTFALKPCPAELSLVLTG
jgi:hypothetical protein